MFHSRTQRQVMVVIVLLAVPSAWSQANTGTISGEIRDPSAAVVVGARVRLIDVQTGVERQGLSNDEGFYKVALVPAGTYRMVTEASGFKSVEVQNIHIDVNQNLTIPVTLEIGQTSESISVTGAAELVDTVSGSVKEVVDESRVRELPLNGRNVLQLQQLVNGAVYAGSGDQQANTPAFQVNGGTLFTNNYTLDGGEHSDSFFNSAITFPNPDAIQEFSIQTSSYSAEYGRNRGATVNAVTRSGSNGFHGTLFEFVRNSTFDARDFFGVRGVAPFKRNQFGATLGGPIIKNKTFFFFAWESTRERGAPTVATFQTLSPAMRTGNFSELSKPIIDPLTNQQFPGNVIPVSRLSLPALNFLSKYTPVPNLPGRLFSGFNNGTFDRDQYIGRVDHEFSSRDRVFVRYLFNHDSSLINRGSFTDWFQDQHFNRQSVTGNETHTFSPGLINSFTFTFNRVTTFIDVIPHFDWNSLGSNLPTTVPNQKGWTIVALPGYFSAQNGVPWDVRRNTFNISNSTTWIRGKHTLRFGTQITRYQLLQFYEYLSDGSITFSGQFTGDPASDFVLGRIASIRQDSPGLNTLRQTLWGFFASDDYRLTPRLTVNLGMRYEPYFGFRELHHDVVAFRPGQQSKVWPQAPLGQLFQGDPGVPDSLFPAEWKNFAPRFGFAWDALGNQKLAVRGGYGIFFDSIAGIRLNRFPLNQPFLLDVTVFDRPLEDPFLGKSPFPYQPPSTPEQKSAYQFVTPTGVSSANANMATPYTQQWNLTLEEQLPLGLVLSTGYVGSKSAKLFGSRNINPAIYAPGATVANTQDRRLYPLFGPIEDEHTVGYSQYHSLQMLLRRRLSAGFTLQAAYTLSKNTGYTGSQSEGSLGTRNALNSRLDKGILSLDATHVISASTVWQLPSPAGSTLLRTALGGWEASGIVQIQTGFPFTVRSGVDNSRSGQGLDSADLVGTPSLTSGSRGQKVQQWFNTKAYAVNAVGGFGTVGIDTLRGPGLWNADIGMNKNFRLGERRELQFRSEFFNIFNNVNLATPNATVISSSFGRITASAAPPRVIEFALKFRF
jgi:outer membrane receptor protein involved in Fe transport